jgi:hypothetical protein
MSLLVAFSLIVPLLAGVSSRPLAPELDVHLDAEMGCEYGDLNNLDPEGRCVKAFVGSTGYSLLLGDSHAGMYSEAFVEASNQLGLDAVISTNSNHPFLYRPWDTELTESEFPFLVLEALESSTKRPSVVVIGQSGYSMGTTNGEQWSDMFIPILQRLEQLGIPVVVIGAAFSVGVEPRSYSFIQVQLGKCEADAVRRTSTLEASRTGRVVEKQIAIDAVRNAVLMNTLPTLCPQKDCRTFRDGKWWWRDNAHVSIIASYAMTPLMKSTMSEALRLVKPGNS